MKGKGKGKDQNANKESNAQQIDLIIELREYSTYSKVVEEAVDSENVIEDMNELGKDLERLLKSVKKRIDNLKKLQDAIPPSDQKTKPPPKTTQASGKKGKTGTVPAKKLKGNTSKAGTGASVGRPSLKNAQNRAREQIAVEAAQSIASSQKSDVPSRFWDSLKPFCADITEDNRKFLEEWAKPLDDDDECFRIPPLGKHFTYEWSHKDIQDEQKEGAKANDKRKCSGASSSVNSSDSEVILKKARRDYSDDLCPFGPLTQRLVSCLMEEDVMTPPDEMAMDTQDSNESQPSNGAIIKSLNIGDPMDLEKRIRKGLEAAGILKPEAENEEDNPQDEVLSELKRVQANLRAVSAHNLNLKKKLLNLVVKEMDKQKLREKLDIVDAQIISLRGNMKSAKQNEKYLKGKEYSDMENKALQLLEERTSILKEIKTVEEIRK